MKFDSCKCCEVFNVLFTYLFIDNRIYITLAADLIFHDVKEPVRIIKEAKVRIFPANEKFWSPTKPKIQEEYLLQLKVVRIVIVFS